MTIRNAIYSRLNGFAGLTALISGPVYSKQVSQDSVRPLVFFEVTGTERISAINGDSGTVIRTIRVISEALTLDAALDVSEQVRAALQRWSGVEDGITIMDTFINDESDSFDDDLNVSYIEQFFTIQHRE